LPSGRIAALGATPDSHHGLLKAAMFVIELTYKVQLTEIDAHMAAHVMFLTK
jgi:hypothetical protein